MLVTSAMCALWLVPMVAQASPSPASATEASPMVAAEARPRIKISVSGAEDQLPSLVPGLLDAMRRLEVEPVLDRAGAAPPRLAVERGTAALPARLFVDLRDAKSALLYVVDDEHERIFVRRFRRLPEQNELLVEQLVLAAASSVEAMLEGQLIGVPRRDYEASLQPEPVAPAPAPALAAPVRRAFGSVSGTYGATWLGDGALTHGPSLGLELERLPWGMGLWTTGRLPTVVGESAPGDISVRLTTLGLRYRAWYEAGSEWRYQLLLGVGIGADFTQVSPRQSSAAVAQALKPYWAGDGLLQAFVGWSRRAPSYRLAIWLGLDVATAPVRYVVETHTGQVTVFAPLRTRPFLELEIAAKVLP